METTTRCKRRYLVNSRYQLPHVGGVVVLSIINGAIIAAVAAWVLLFGLDSRMSTNLSASFLYSIAGVFVITAGFSMYWSLRYTRHIAGLLHKVTVVLRDIADGKPVGEPVRFRKNDAEFKSLEREINRLFEIIDRREDSHRKTAILLNELREKLNSDAFSREECFAELRAAINTLNGGTT